MFRLRLKQLREDAGLSQSKLAKEIGVAQSTVGMWENGTNMPENSKLMSLSKFFDVSTDYLLGNSDIKNPSTVTAEGDIFNIDGIMPMPKMKKVPLIGTIPCGKPILAEEVFEEYVEVPDNISAEFSLRCKGDSMINARINDGDIVYIQQQNIVENGEIAAVLIDDNEATLKRVYLYNDRIVLQPENPAYSPLIYVKEEMNNVHIIGKAVYFLSTVK